MYVLKVLFRIEGGGGGGGCAVSIPATTPCKSQGLCCKEPTGKHGFRIDQTL